MRKTRLTAAIVLLSGAIVINIIVLARAEESPGWPIAVIVLLGAAGASLLVQQRGM